MIAEEAKALLSSVEQYFCPKQRNANSGTQGDSEFALKVELESTSLKFPTLPANNAVPENIENFDRTVADLCKFMPSLFRYLESVDFEQPIVYLPVLDYARNSVRFKLQKGLNVTPCLVRSLSKRIAEKIMSSSSRGDLVCLEEESAMGKSYAIYIAVAMLWKAKVRVVYIQDCAKWAEYSDWYSSLFCIWQWFFMIRKE